MAEPVSISRGIAQRYAAAIFDLANEGNALPALESDVGLIGDALAASEDMRHMIASPLVPRGEKEAAIREIATRAGAGTLMVHALALMTRKRRLFILPQMLQELTALLADARGEVTAEVVSATALSDEQKERLARALAARAGKTVKLQASVDESLIGGLAVRLGSMMIDTSVKAKLAALRNAMKEVG